MNTPLRPSPRPIRAWGMTLWALLLSVLSLVAEEPPLDDFGFGNKSRPPTWPLLVVLVQFTDGDFVGTVEDWDHYIFDAGSPSNTLNGFFAEASNGRFQFVRGGTIMVRLPGTDRHSNILQGLKGTNEVATPDQGAAADRLYTSNIVWHAMLATNFNFADYDTPPYDNLIDGDELTIAVINNEGFVAGRYPGVVQPDPDGVAYNNGMLSLQRNSFAESAFETMCHEVCHTIGAEDMYGAWASSELIHQGLSIMSSKGGVCHPDAWHKLQFGWTEPRLHSLRHSGVVSIPAASSGGVNAPVLLYDPDRGPDEFFLLEYRTRTNSTQVHHYDANVWDNGLVLWHVYQTNRWPVQYGDLLYPEAEPGWRECLHCRSLVREEAADLPCAAPGFANHEPYNAGSPSDDHRLVAYDPSYGGQTNWRHCQKCGCLYYHLNGQPSVCAADHENHEMLPGSPGYQIRMDVPDLAGHTYWRRCTNCQVLYIEHHPDDYGVSDCPAPDQTRHLGSTNRYVLIARWGYLSVMAEAPPDLRRADHTVWTGGMRTPWLRWYDQTPVRVYLRVWPFTAGDQSITVGWTSEAGMWVDFQHAGDEDGSFLFPFDTLAEGVNAVEEGGFLYFKAGATSEAANIYKGMKLRAHGGPVRIGR